MKSKRLMREDANSKIKEKLLEMLSSGRMAGAVLFAGGNSESRKQIGMWLCQEVLCKDEASTKKFLHENHEDFILIKKPDDKETIVVSQIEELIDRLAFKPFGDCYAVLISDAHLLREASQNKLLKTLEEPASEAMMVLLTERLDAILPTVRSRCITFVLEEEANEASESVKAMAKLFTQLILNGAPYYKKKAVLSDILEGKDNSRERALEFLDTLEETLEKELLNGNKVSLISKAIKQAETSRAYLKQVHSVAYTLKQMCLRV